jgi:two-component system nitrogen regulation response regulator GlnG
MDGTVLVADDDKTIRTVLTQALTRAGCKVQATASLVTLMRWVSEGKGNLVISDIIMPDGNGLELLPEIRKMRPDLPVIIISAQNTLTTAIKVEEGRAFDYLPKPFDLPNLLHKASLGLNNIESGIGKKLPPLSENLPLIGSSPAMLEVYRKLAKLMNLEDTVFIFGENGTGKTLIANTIHNFSDRRNLPFIKVHHDFFSNFERTLDFFKSAKGGSILIEDIDLLDQQRQKTLRLLLDYDFEISPRFLITAKSQDSGKFSDNNFEPSLLFRVNKLTINVPPLRFRLSDLETTN